MSFLQYPYNALKSRLDTSEDVWLSFTPSLAQDGGSGASYTIQSGRYKFIGKTCHFYARVRVSSKNTNTGTIYFFLPVAHKNSGWDGYVTLHGFVGESGASINTKLGEPTLQQFFSGSYITFVKNVFTGVSPSTGERTRWEDVTGTGTEFQVSGTYEIE